MLLKLNTRVQGLHHVFNPGGGARGRCPLRGPGAEPLVGGGTPPCIAGVWGRSPHRGQGAEPLVGGLFFKRKLDNFDAFSST